MPAKNHRKALADAKLTVKALAEACGMTRFGVMICLDANRPPKNPLAAAAYLKALGLTLPAGKGAK